MSERPVEWLHRLPRPRPVPDRDAHLLDLCRGRRVLHVGAVDSGLLSERLDRQHWLHAALCGAAQRCVGVDIDARGLERARGLGYTEMYLADVEQPDWAAPNGPFDVVLAADVIEHVASPGQLLHGVSRAMDPVGRLVLTTPNAYRIENAVLAWAGFELIHPQHILLFSPRTLLALLDRHGFEVEEVFVYPTTGSLEFRTGEGIRRRAGKVAYTLLDQTGRFLWGKRRGYLADGLGIVARRRIPTGRTV